MPRCSSTFAGIHDSSAPVSTRTSCSATRSPGAAGFSSSIVVRKVPMSSIIKRFLGRQASNRPAARRFVARTHCRAYARRSGRVKLRIDDSDRRSSPDSPSCADAVARQRLETATWKRRPGNGSGKHRLNGAAFAFLLHRRRFHSPFPLAVSTRRFHSPFPLAV
jgi:hypothetical protein